MESRSRYQEIVGMAEYRSFSGERGLTQDGLPKASAPCLAGCASVRLIGLSMGILRVSCNQCCLAALGGQVEKGNLVLMTPTVQASDNLHLLHQQRYFQLFTSSLPVCISLPYGPSQQILQHFHGFYSRINFSPSATLSRSKMSLFRTPQITILFLIPEGRFFTLFSIFFRAALTSLALLVSISSVQLQSGPLCFQLFRILFHSSLTTTHFSLRRPR
jgi:hypothetical protein